MSRVAVHVVDEAEVALLEDADRCRNLLRAIVEQARKDARGVRQGLSDQARKAMREDALEFLSSVGAQP